MIFTAILGSCSYRIAVAGNVILTNDTLENGVYIVVVVVRDQKHIVGSFEVREGTIGAFSDVHVSRQEHIYRRSLLNFMDALEDLTEKLNVGVTWGTEGEIESAWYAFITAHIAVLKKNISVLETLLASTTSHQTLQRHGYSDDHEICQDIERVKYFIAAWKNTFT